MIVEMRTYTLALGATATYFRKYGEKGLAVQKRILGHLVGYYSVEVGPLNQVIHLWGYDSFEDRAKRRAALWADAEWLEYVRDVAGLVVKQENQILSPAPFFNVPRPE
ncbi:MAG: NIPSNAP family protein [Caulobacterales bacterium]